MHELRCESDACYAPAGLITHNCNPLSTGLVYVLGGNLIREFIDYEHLYTARSVMAGHGSGSALNNIVYL